MSWEYYKSADLVPAFLLLLCSSSFFFFFSSFPPFVLIRQCLYCVPCSPRGGIWTLALASCWKMTMGWSCCSSFWSRQLSSCCKPRSCEIQWTCRRNILLSFCPCCSRVECGNWSCTCNTSCFCLRWRCSCSCFWHSIWTGCCCEHLYGHLVR